MKLANGKNGCDICKACFTCGTPKKVLNGKELCPRCYELELKK